VASGLGARSTPQPLRRRHIFWRSGNLGTGSVVLRQVFVQSCVNGRPPDTRHLMRILCCAVSGRRTWEDSPWASLC
jgi:hypothetical protein